MTKTDLVQEIFKTDRNRPERSFNDSGRIHGNRERLLSRGKEVYLRGFGSFIIKDVLKRPDAISAKIQLWLSRLIMAGFQTIKEFSKKLY